MAVENPPRGIIAWDPSGKPEVVHAGYGGTVDVERTIRAGKDDNSPGQGDLPSGPMATNFMSPTVIEGVEMGMATIDESDLVYKGPRVRSAQKRQVLTLEKDYAFPRATCRSSVNLMWSVYIIGGLTKNKFRVRYTYDWGNLGRHLNNVSYHNHLILQSSI
jgi:hypothetical protein